MNRAWDWILVPAMYALEVQTSVFGAEPCIRPA
jgi:hypothetical protein